MGGDQRPQWMVNLNNLVATWLEIIPKVGNRKGIQEKLVKYKLRNFLSDQSIHGCSSLNTPQSLDHNLTSGEVVPPEAYSGEHQGPTVQVL